jgi:tRNA 2-thiocytidine biosynthesis protein TtcA
MRDLTKTGSKINSAIGRAIHDYELIKNGDKILIAVSGGKDSMTLLHLLRKIREWAPVDFELFAAHISTDFRCGGCAHESALSELFEDYGLKYAFRDIKVLDENGKTTCFWCSWNRRKALFDIAEEFGCNKIALGHHKDDIVETMLMNLFYKGEISVMNPRQELFDGKVAIIRPLAYVEEDAIIAFAKEEGFPEHLCNCPFGRDSKRKFVKSLLQSAEESNPGVNVKTNIFRSVSRIKNGYIDLKDDTETLNE